MKSSKDNTKMFVPENLRLARLTCELTQVELADKIGIHQSHLSQMETGERDFPEGLLAPLSIATGFLPAFYFQPLENRINWGSRSLLFRRATSKYVEQNVSASAKAEVAFDAFRKISWKYEAPKVILRDLARLSQGGADVEAIAANIRSFVRLPIGTPIDNLTKAIEESGVLVFAMPYLEGGVKAFSFWSNDKPIIVIRTDITGEEFNWNLAHELIHLCIHRNLDRRQFELREVEKQAQQITAEFLLPSVQFREELGSQIDLRRILDLKVRWQVGSKSILFRAEQIGCITKSGVKHHMGRMKYFNYSDSQPSPLNLRRPRFFRQVCEKRFGTPILISAVRKETHLPSKLIFEVLSSHSGKTENLEQWGTHRALH